MTLVPRLRAHISRLTNEFELVPRVTWPAWRRVRWFGLVAMLIAVLILVFEALFADWTNGRSFNQYTPGGWSPLAPALLLAGIGIPLGGIALGLLLPLYRHRLGAAVIGPAVLAAIVLPVILASPVSGASSPDTPWQRWLLIVGTIIVSVVIASSGRRVFLKGKWSDSTDASLFDSW
jgi:hypothetical protein